MVDYGKILGLFGSLFLVLSLLSNLMSRWPKIPGDIYIDRPAVKLYIPWLTTLVLSVILTIYFNYFKS